MKATEVIRRDHRAVEEVFANYKKANEERREAMLDAIFDSLDAHEKMEDEHFYPALKEALGDDEDLAELEREQTLLKVEVAAAKVLPVGRQTAFEAAMPQVLAHAKKEEETVLRKAEEKMSETMLEEMGAKMEPASAVALDRKK